MDETIHPDAYCTLSNMSCGDLSEALNERDRLRARVAELEAEKGGYARDWDICMTALEKIADLIPDLNTLGEAVEIANGAINATLPKP